MNLLDRRGPFQLLGRVPEDLLIGRAVVQPAAIAVDECDHIGGIFANQLKELIALRQLASNALELQILINRVKVEKQYQSCQTTCPFPEIKPVRCVGLSIKPGKSERNNPEGQCQHDRNGEPPQPPLTTFDPTHLSRNRLGAVPAHLLE